MSSEHAFVGRARELLRAAGGWADDSTLVAQLFGPLADPEHWAGLLDTLFAPATDLRHAEQGGWEIATARPAPRGRPTELRYVTLATATTALDPRRGRVAQLVAVRVDGGQPISTFESAFNPRCRLPQYVIEATGLGQAEAEEAPLFADLVDELLGFLGDDPLVGAEIHSQAEAINRELSRLDRSSLGNPRLDLQRLADLAGLAISKPSLPLLAAAVGLSHPRPYRPAVDARVAARVASQLLTRAEQRGIVEAAILFQAQAAPSRLLRRSEPIEAPDRPGVYLLKDAGGQILYVGKARNLRHRLSAYHRRQLGLLRRLEGLAEAVAQIEIVPATSDLEALILESRLLHEYRPRYNTQRRRRQPALFLRAQLEPASASLTACRQTSPDGATYLGPFRTVTATAQALRLVRQVFPELKRRARAPAIFRRLPVGRALKFLMGEKDEVIKLLRFRQRCHARAGDRQGVEAVGALLRQVVAWEPDTAAFCSLPIDDHLLVLSPVADERILAHLLDAGRLIACFEVADQNEARQRAAHQPPVPALEPEVAADEASILVRWLGGLGPEHRIERVSSLQ